MFIYRHENVFYLLYDGAGPKGWQCCLATSRDLKKWEKKGVVLELGGPADPDSRYTGYGPVLQADGKWILFYAAGRNASPGPQPAQRRHP